MTEKNLRLEIMKAQQNATEAAKQANMALAFLQAGDKKAAASYLESARFNSFLASGIEAEWTGPEED